MVGHRQSLWGLELKERGETATVCDGGKEDVNDCATCQGPVKGNDQAMTNLSGWAGSLQTSLLNKDSKNKKLTFKCVLEHLHVIDTILSTVHLVAHLILMGQVLVPVQVIGMRNLRHRKVTCRRSYS